MSLFDEPEMANVGHCCSCKAPMWIPTSLYKAAKHSARVLFYCSFGHAQHFVEGETEAQKLRRERDRLAQRVAERDDEIKALRDMRDTANRRASAARGQVTKIKRRVANGVCPCCNRTFANLARHISSQHPQFKAEEVAA